MLVIAGYRTLCRQNDESSPCSTRTVLSLGFACGTTQACKHPLLHRKRAHLFAIRNHTISASSCRLANCIITHHAFNISKLIRIRVHSLIAEFAVRSRNNNRVGCTIVACRSLQLLPLPQFTGHCPGQWPPSTCTNRIHCLMRWRMAGAMPTLRPPTLSRICQRLEGSVSRVLG